MSGFELDLTNVFIAAYIVEVLVAALWAYPGILRYWREEHGQASILWSAIVVTKGLAVFVSTMLIPLGIAAILQLPRFPFTGVIVIGTMMLLVAPVIVYRIVFDRIRAKGEPITSGDVHFAEIDSRLDAAELSASDETIRVNKGQSAQNRRLDAIDLRETTKGDEQ